MEIQNDAEELNLYQSYLEDIDIEKVFLFTNDNPEVWENNWFCENETEDEENRICIVISLAVYEIEKNKISKKMINEIEYYYNEVFVKKSFDRIFEDKEAEKDCFNDVKKCYEFLKNQNML